MQSGHAGDGALLAWRPWWVFGSLSNAPGSRPADWRSCGLLGHLVETSTFCRSSRRSISFSGNMSVSTGTSTLELAIPACALAHSTYLLMSDVVAALSMTDPTAGSAKLPVR